MSNSQHEIGATSNYYDHVVVGGNSKPMLPYGMSFSCDVNMTNCFKHCRRFFFQKYTSIKWEVMFAYWMMAGYLGRVRSFQEAREKAWDTFRCLPWTPRISRISRTCSTLTNGIMYDESYKEFKCKHKGLCVLENLGFVHLLDLGEIRAVQFAQDGHLFDLYGRDPQDNLIRIEYFDHFHPTPKPLLENENTNNLDNLSVLLIRGCLFFPSRNIQNLTVLEISGSACFTTLPTETISKLTRLRCLNLSNLPIQCLPDNLFHKLRQLSWLIIRGCSKLCSFPSISHLTKLVVLDLSHCPGLQEPIFLDIRYPQLQMLDLSYTPIFYGFRELSAPNLTHLSLRGLKLKHLLLSNDPHNLHALEGLDLSNCEQLVSLSPLVNHTTFMHLKQFNLSGCTSFTNLHESLLDQMSCLVNLDLSWTKLKHLPFFAHLTSLRKLSLRGMELDSVETLASVSNLLVELDLAYLKTSSSQGLELDFLKSFEKLETLNLSHTSVTKLPDMSKLVSLSELLLADCQQLKVVPTFQHLDDLRTLDLSLPNDSSIGNRQLEVEPNGQTFLPRLGLWNLELVLTNRSGIRELFPKTALEDIGFYDLRGTDVADWGSKLKEQQPEERIPRTAEIHSIFSKKSNQPSGFEQYGDVFKDLNDLISDIQKKLNSAMATTDHALKMQLERLYADLRYILENIDILKNSRNWKSREDLLQELIDVASNFSAVDSANVRQLSRLVVRLKLLVPPKQIDDSKDLEITKNKKKKSPLVMSKNKENNGIANIAKDIQPGIMPDLLTSFESLSNVHKRCLLCFSIFPYAEVGDKGMCGVKSLVIRKKILIYWWVGEGFIDPHHEESVDQNADTNPSKEMTMSKEIGAGREKVNEQVSATQGVKKPKTIEEIGKQILKVLVEKGFIQPVMKKGRESGSCRMHPFVHYFVIERAKEEGFFDFDRERNLTPHFTRSGKACLLRPQVNFPSSCELWAKHISSPKKMESFKTVKTLFNVNESMIKIKQEWFSQMKNLHVLHLGIWCSENTDPIEVADEKFLEDLKRMKHLRLLSLQGMPAIMKLPDSVCQLSNLIILDLKECSYLEELPTDIGSLRNLIHLDISDCPLFYKLPKGISLLSKLEVLRGFVITDLHAARGPQDRNASILSRWWERTKHSMIYGLFHHKKNEVCTLVDLLKLERLRELSLVVNIRKFPDDEDLKVFRGMKQLRKLKILWEKNIHAKIATEKKRKCSEHQPGPNGGQDFEENKHLHNIEKLELWCFPHENAPDWLNPGELKNLEKLNIVGGDLSKFPENKWNVKSLRLKYLHKLEIQWSALKNIFPQLEYLEKDQCDQLADFPCDKEGVWKSTS